MTYATVTFPIAHGRVFPLANYRPFLNGVVIGLGTVVAVCALVAVVTVASAWIINIALATNRYMHALVPLESGTKALAKYDSTLASAPHAYKSARLSTAPADDPEVTFEARWARAMDHGQVSAVTLVSEHPLEGANNMLSQPPPLLDVPHSPAKSQIALAPLNPVAAPASPLPSTLPLPPKAPEWSNTFPLPRPRPFKEIAGSPVRDASSSTERNSPQQVHNKSMSLPDPDSRTAIYDISARTVYLPSGEKLEAHSGLGDKLDDPRYVHVKMRGPTPPNVYDLTLREKLFLGVRAIRLNPVDDDKMFGRGGILAHSYMLGSSGQSNGCVVFKQYPRFLQAFLSGKVDRLVVVPDLDTEPSRTARSRRGHDGQYAFNN
jgi:type VI secretion system (T6SS) effector TldE1-like protein